ncbi:MAG: hypothetical protein KBS98_00195 [Flavobacterium sp.]|nr:hypothetical protein [Candidatus Neoflavobacterium equi]
MAKENKKGIYKGVIEQDEKGNFFCGEYLLDYKQTKENFAIGDEIYINSYINNPSDASYEAYPKKAKLFFPYKEIDPTVTFED